MVMEGLMLRYEDNGERESSLSCVWWAVVPPKIKV